MNHGSKWMAEQEGCTGPNDPRLRDQWHGPLPELTAQERASLRLTREDAYRQKGSRAAVLAADVPEITTKERRSMKLERVKRA